MKKEIGIGLLICLVIIAGFRFFSKSKNTRLIETATATIGNIEEVLTISGQIDASTKSTLRFPLSGKIVWIGISEGQAVKKWQALASLDRTSLAATSTNAYYKYLAADANAKLVEDQVKGHDTDENLTQKNTRVAAQSARDQAWENWKQAEHDLANSTLFSPIDGLAVGVPQLTAGSIISTPTQAEFLLVDPNSVYFSATADQTEVGKLVAGQSGELVLDAYPNMTIPGTVSVIGFSPKTGETSTVYEVKFNLNLQNQNYKYKLGMTGDLSFVAAKKTGVLIIPGKFVKLEGDKKYVYKDTKMKTKTPVETGLETDTGIEIVSGLSEGEVVYE
jgi:RND family efflux transporter MFP subunit